MQSGSINKNKFIISKEFGTFRNLLLQEGWEFFKCPKNNPILKLRDIISNHSIKWQKILIPHDWDRDGPFSIKNKSGDAGGYVPAGLGWYRRKIILPSKLYNWKNFKNNNSRVLLYFDGIYMNATLWLNDIEICNHLYGYSPFEIDITEFLDDSNENWLYIRVDNRKQPNCRWYSGSGIYRSVFLKILPPITIRKNKTFIETYYINSSHSIKSYNSQGNGVSYNKNETTSNNNIIKNKSDSARIKISTQIWNFTKENKTIFLDLVIKNKNGREIYKISKKLDVIPKSDNYLLSEQDPQLINSLDFDLEIENPDLWYPEDPNLNYMELTLYNSEKNNPKLQNGQVENAQVNKKIMDQIKIKFGIRILEFSDKGFFLNGKSYLLKGVNLHHDGGLVGAAVPNEVWKRRLFKLKQIGCNSIRTSHNPPSVEFLDLCDEFGFLVIHESFDKWFHPGKRYDWIRKGFKKDWEKELSAIIQRDRNHPSIILWSMGNEIKGIKRPKTKKQYAKMASLTQSLDPTRDCTVVLAPGRLLNALADQKEPNILDLTDVICTNYTECYFPKVHEKWPNKAIISAEAYHYWRKKLPEETDLKPKPNHPDYTARHGWFDIIKHQYAVGLYLWVGIEYLGEVRDPFPYHGRTNAPIRITGFIKPQAYFMQALWLEKPMAESVVVDEKAGLPPGKIHFDFPPVVHHWSFPNREGELMKVFTYTNCEEVELRLNNKSFGIKKAAEYPYQTMSWDITYEPGLLETIGYNNGKIVSQASLKTCSKPHHIDLVPSKNNIKANNLDTVVIEIYLKDKDDNICVNDNIPFEFVVHGPARLLGVDSGDLRTMDPYSGNKTMFFWGTSLGIIQATNSEGIVKVRVKPLNEKYKTIIPGEIIIESINRND